MKFTKIVMFVMVLGLNTSSFAGDKAECPPIYADPFGYFACQVVGTTLSPFVLSTLAVVSSAGTTGTAINVHKEALLNEAAPYAANYLIAPESELSNPVFRAAIQVVAGLPNAEVQPTPELAQMILDSVAAKTE